MAQGVLGRLLSRLLGHAAIAGQGRVMIDDPPGRLDGVGHHGALARVETGVQPAVGPGDGQGEDQHDDAAQQEYLGGKFEVFHGDSFVTWGCFRMPFLAMAIAEANWPMAVSGSSASAKKPALPSKIETSNAPPLNQPRSLEIANQLTKKGWPRFVATGKSKSRAKDKIFLIFQGPTEGRLGHVLGHVAR